MFRLVVEEETPVKVTSKEDNGNNDTKRTNKTT